jgi:lysophospholipase L1-like esterase
VPAVRRFWFWYLPIGAAVAAVALFAWGLAAFLRGDTGTPVEILRVERPAVAPAAEIAPLVLGDSLARGAGDPAGLGIGGRLEAALKERKIDTRRVWNLAVNGARTADLLDHLERPNVRDLIRQSNVIIVSIGGNDLWGRNEWRSSAPPDAEAVMTSVLSRVEEIIRTIRDTNPDARIFFIGLYNPFVETEQGKELNALVNQWNATLLETFGEDPDFTLVQTSDLFSHRDRLALDRFHPGGEAYGLIAKRIAESL